MRNPTTFTGTICRPTIVNNENIAYHGPQMDSFQVLFFEIKKIDTFGEKHRAVMLIWDHVCTNLYNSRIFRRNLFDKYGVFRDPNL